MPILFLLVCLHILFMLCSCVHARVQGKGQSPGNDLSLHHVSQVCCLASPGACLECLHLGGRGIRRCRSSWAAYRNVGVFAVFIHLIILLLQSFLVSLHFLHRISKSFVHFYSLIEVYI